MSTALSVVVVHRNDHERAQLRGALEALSGVQVAGDRADLRGGVALAHQTRPAILVLELAQPIEDSLTAASQFKLEHPDVAIFFSTEIFDPDTLLRAMRVGATEVLRRPLDRAALTQAVERVAALTARKHGGTSSRQVFTVFSNKGGQGVSTIATNLALGLKKASGSEVALVDFDYHSGDVAFLLGLDIRRSLGDVIAASKIDSATIQDALLKHPSGISVLAQPEQLDRVDGFSAHQAGSIVEILASTFENVVIDAPHVFNDITLEVFDRSSSVLLVVEPSVPSVRAARRSLEIFNKLNYLMMPDRVRLVLNRQSDQSAIRAPQLEETLGLPVFATVANDFAVVSEAINTGKPLCGDVPVGRAGRDLAALARKLMPADVTNGAMAEPVQARRGGRMRLFGRGSS